MKTKTKKKRVVAIADSGIPLINCVSIVYFGVPLFIGTRCRSIWRHRNRWYFSSFSMTLPSNTAGKLILPLICEFPELYEKEEREKESEQKRLYVSRYVAQIAQRDVKPRTIKFFPTKLK